ncbi:hypothetical protein M513_10766 [Trichuris suis]|uniref:HTH OST-type domain-containing protein n=1 Tax=Trichuris suis TaxID=68888 RepID=A0A085LTQ8_9BILA|nr:hypothetical protein M513_10766 [Trichuris suis]
MLIGWTMRPPADRKVDTVFAFRLGLVLCSRTLVEVLASKESFSVAFPELSMDRDTLEKDLHSVLFTFKHGATGRDFVQAYRDCLGHPLDLAKLGYRSVDELMASFPDVVERYKSSSGIFVYKAKPHPATKQLENLIASQNDTSEDESNFGVLRPLQPRPVLLDTPACTPAMSQSAQVCKPMVREPLIKPLIDVKASFPNRYPTNNGSITRGKPGAAAIKQSANTSYQVANRGATSANFPPTYEKPRPRPNFPSVPRQGPLSNTVPFVGDVAPAYWNCPGRFRWKFPAANPAGANRQPQRSCTAAAAVDENRPDKKIGNQSGQNDKTAPLSNSSGINQTTNLPVSETQATKAEPDALLTAEEKRVDNNAAEGKAEGCQVPELTSSISRESEKNGLVTCAADDGGATHNVISEQNTNNAVNKNVSSGDKDGDNVSKRSLNALSNCKNVANPCMVEEDSIKVEVVKFLDADLVTFVRADAESKSQFKTLLNEMRFAYGGDIRKPPELPKSGEQVAVQFNEYWLRAIVCAVFDFDSALVFYSDLGGLQKVELTKAFPLFPRFSEVPQMAFVGKLLGVPRNLWNGSIESLNDWFKRMTRNNEVVAVASDHNWSLRVGIEPVNLYLHMKQSGINVDLNSLVKTKCMEMVGSTTVALTIMKCLGKAIEYDNLLTNIR